MADGARELTAEQVDQIEKARKRLEESLSGLPGWGITNPVKYENEAQLYQDTFNTWRHNWDATDPRYYHVTTTSTLLTHRWQSYTSLPHLFFYGPRHSGKGQALRITQALSPRPLLVTAPSVNSIYQIANFAHPTLLMDEMDWLGKVKDNGENVQAMLQILNVYTRGEPTMRGGKDGIPQIYDLFCPKMLAGQKELPGSLPDRCIRLDCEKNVADIPMDLDLPETLRGQLEMYQNRPAENENGITSDQFRQLVGDNRLTQLWYPYYDTCPVPEGQKAILDLAIEALNERDTEERSSDLAQVLEELVKYVVDQAGPGATVATVVTDDRREPFAIDTSMLSSSCRSFIPLGKGGKEQDPHRWLGWRLKELQIPVERSGHSNLRLAMVKARLLGKKLRRYAPDLLSPKTTETTVTTVAKPSSICPQCRKPITFPHEHDNRGLDELLYTAGAY